jgi:dTDP-4-dehydrorhamnose reductase
VKKVFILGAAGMAGHMIHAYLRQHKAIYDLITIARNDQLMQPDIQMDISDFSGLRNIIDSHQPDYIINCIGVLNQDAERNIDRAILLNSYLPHYLETITSQLSTRLIHISTDCVFSGKAGNYREEDVKDGQGYYAQSKSLGEVNNDKDITIRTSIIGPELKNDGIGLFDWIMKQSGEISGYTQAIWSGVTTLELAKFIHYFMQNATASGIIHLTNNQPISKYHLLQLIKEVYQLDHISIEPSDNYHSNKSFINTRKLVDYTVPDYKTMIEELKNWHIVN